MKSIYLSLLMTMTLACLSTGPAYAVEKTLPQLQAAGAVSDDDLFLCRQNGDTEDSKCTGEQVKTYLQEAVGCGISNEDGELNTSQCADRSIALDEDTITADDCGRILVYSNASGTAVDIAAASTPGLTEGCAFTVNALSTAGPVTITPTISEINGASSLIIPAGTGCYIRSDGTDYQIDLSACTAVATSSDVDFSGYSALTAVDDEDFLLVNDVSATDNLKATVSELFKSINTLTTTSDPQTTDKLVLYDASATASAAITFGDFFKTINFLSETTTPDPAADFVAIYDDSAFGARKVKVAALASKEYCVAMSDQSTALTTGNTKANLFLPAGATVKAVRAYVNTAPTGSTLTVDINEAGSTILSTKLTIDASEKTSGTAATAAVISDTAIAANAELTFDIDQVGSTIAGAGLVACIEVNL